MAENIGERLAVVETTVATLQQTVTEMATDVRTIRDHVVKEKATRAAWKRAFTWVGGGLVGLGTLYEAFGGPKIHF